MNSLPPEKNVEKRPDDWSASERLEAVIHCASLDAEQSSAYCRSQGIYPHHVTQWKCDFESADNKKVDKAHHQKMKSLKAENRSLQKELNRKDKALAETAALLTLKKKAQDLWGNSEDSE